jgi:spermidine synthase
LAAPARRFSGEIELGDEFALLGGIIAGPASLAEFSADAPLNLDDRPVVAYLAPRITYEPDSAPRDRLLELLQTLHVEPREIFGEVDAGWSRRLSNYWAARDAYLDAGRRVQPTGDVRGMLAQVRDPLLSVLRISPDFRPAYEPLVQMARALGQSDAVEARSLLITLAAVRPEWPEASNALAELTAR